MMPWWGWLLVGLGCWFSLVSVISLCAAIAVYRDARRYREQMRRELGDVS